MDIYIIYERLYVRREANRTNDEARFSYILLRPLNKYIHLITFLQKNYLRPTFLLSLSIYIFIYYLHGSPFNLVIY